MKIVHWTLLLAAFAASCSEAPSHNTETSTQPTEEVATPGEACSVQLPGLTFTRSLNDAAQSVTVAGSKLTLRSAAKRDYFNDPDQKLSNNTAPVLLTAIDNTKPFTFTAKITPGFRATYDAGVLYIFQRNDLWQKFAFEQDERGNTRIVSVRTIGTSDDNNHDVVRQKQVFMKISSDTKTVGFYYSLDNVTWHLARLYKNEYPAQTWVGLSAQSPLGEGMSAQFEDCTLTQASIQDFRLGV